MLEAGRTPLAPAREGNAVARDAVVAPLRRPLPCGAVDVLARTAVVVPFRMPELRPVADGETGRATPLAPRSPTVLADAGASARTAVVAPRKIPDPLEFCGTRIVAPERKLVEGD
jgi:hypothetical protein